MDLVTLDEVKLFCRLDGTFEDSVLAILIGAATEAALAIADEWDRTGEVPARLKLAVLMHVAQAYDAREDGAGVPPGSTRLLMPLRKLDV